MRKISAKKLTLSALFLAIALYLPFLTGQIQVVGKALSPMHIPALLTGFVCGWPYAIAVGVISPLLRSLIFGMPPLFPTATAMALELATYGAVAGLLYKAFPKNLKTLYLELIASMLIGRVVWGLATWLFMAASGNSFSFEAFLAGAFTAAVPGIILHLILVPLVVKGLEKAHLLEGL